MPLLDRGDAKVWWEEEGTGDPVLLITGLGWPSDTWFRLVPALSDRYRVLRVDNRGTGRSSVPTEATAMETLADDAAAVLADAGVQRAHVVGFSMGGVVAQELALRHPDRVRSLVLASTHPGGPAAVPMSAEARESLKARRRMEAEEAARHGVPLEYAADTPAELVAEDIAVRVRRPTPAEGYTAQFHGMVGHAGTHDRLGAITVPTLVLHGEADRLVDPGNAQVLAAAIPEARLRLLPGAGHVVFTDRADEAAAEVRRFLDEVGGRFVLPVRVRYLEADQQGVVFNMWYLGWFDEAMMAFLAAGGLPVSDLLAQGLDTQLVHTEVDWTGAARWGDEVQVEVTADAVGTTSFTLGFRVRRGRETLVRASTVYVIVATDGSGKRPVPDSLRELMRRGHA